MTQNTRNFRANHHLSEIDDPYLPQRITTAAEQAQLCLRDQIIIYIALESGAHISRIISLTVGSWRTRGCQCEILAPRKGSRGQSVSVLCFSPETATLLRHYINGERKQCDPQNRELTLLADADPLFLSPQQQTYTYGSFFPHWKAVCKAANISLPLRGLRQWFVIQSLQWIDKNVHSSEESKYRKEDLAERMGWSSSDPLNVYEHYLREKRSLELLDQFERLLYDSETP